MKEIKTPSQWLKQKKYAHIKEINFLRGSQLFPPHLDPKYKTPNDYPMNKAEFEARLQMAHVIYHTKSYVKIHKEIQAIELPVETMITTPKGNILLNKGDYILYDENGHPHPMRAENFKKIYESIDDIKATAFSMQLSPMGVSQWKEHGKKYGYWKYFLEKNASTK